MPETLQYRPSPLSQSAEKPGKKMASVLQEAPRAPSLYRSPAIPDVQCVLISFTSSTLNPPGPSFSHQMILFSACCICGLIGGILNFQFLRAVTKKTSSLYPLHLASMSLACIGIGGCTLSSWLTCRLASYEQRRMFSEREHSLHHSHEMAEKVSFVLFPLTASKWWRLQSHLGDQLAALDENLRYWIL